MGALIALLALLAIAKGASGSSKKSSGGDKLPPKAVVPNDDGQPGSSGTPTGEPTGDKSIAVAPGESSGSGGGITFKDLDKTVLAADRDLLIASAALKEAWPGINSLPGAWQDAGLNLVQTLPYSVMTSYFKTGSDPDVAGVDIRASADRIYNFASELEDAIKANVISGFGTNGALAVKELILAGRYLEHHYGVKSAYRWGALYIGDYTDEFDG